MNPGRNGPSSTDAQYRKFVQENQMKNKLKVYALVAEIAGGIAIVVSLIAVAMQISISSEQMALNTSAVQAAAYQTLAGDIMAINRQGAENAQLAELVLRIRNGGNFENQTEEFQYDSYINQFLEFGDMAYYQYQKGVINEDRLLNVLGPLINKYEVKYVRDRYQSQYKVRIDPEFAVYLEEVVADRYRVP